MSAVYGDGYCRTQVSFLVSRWFSSRYASRGLYCVCNAEESQNADSFVEFMTAVVDDFGNLVRVS